MLKDYYYDFTTFGSSIFYVVLILASYSLGQFYLTSQLLVVLALCYAIGFPVKIFFFKERPQRQSYTNILEKFDAAAFPSVHAMQSFSFGIILIAFFRSISFTMLVLLLIVGVIYTRVALKKHDLKDISVGSLIGVGIALVVLFTPLPDLLLPFLS